MEYWSIGVLEYWSVSIGVVGGLEGWNGVRIPAGPPLHPSTTPYLHPSITPFLPAIDAHDAAQEVDDSYVVQAELAHLGRYTLLGRVMLERFEDIGIRAGVAAEKPPEAGYK